MVTDEETVFTTVIFQTDLLPPGVESYPRPLMRWSENLWSPVYSPHGNFNLQENGEHCSDHPDTHAMLFLSMAPTLKVLRVPATPICTKN